MGDIESASRTRTNLERTLRELVKNVQQLCALVDGLDETNRSKYKVSKSQISSFPMRQQNNSRLGMLSFPT